ncbi:hypothetical protein D3C78_1072030 [compost metagenome]
MSLATAGRHIQRRAELRIAAGIVENRLAAADFQRQRHAAWPAANGILVGIVGKEVIAIGNPGEDLPGLLFRIVENLAHTVQKIIKAETGNDLLHLAFADVDGGDLGVEVADILFRHADIGLHHVDDEGIEPAFANELDRRDAQAFLLDFGKRAGQ